MAGKGRSRAALSGTVVPLLAGVAGLRLTVLETRARMHAAELVEGLDLGEVDLLLFMGGDGTTHEGLQVRVGVGRRGGGAQGGEGGETGGREGRGRGGEGEGHPERRVHQGRLGVGWMDGWVRDWPS